MPKNSQKNYKDRLTICKECPNFRLNICKVCKCFMPLKTRIKRAQCPNGLWR